MSRSLPSSLAAGALAAAAILGACSSEPTSIPPEFAGRGSSVSLSVTPSSLQLTTPGLAKTFTAMVQYAGLLTASSSNPGCATVSPTSTTSREKPAEGSVYLAEFTVTPVGAGSCTVTVTDKKGNVAYVGVMVVLGRIAFSHPTLDPPTPYQIYVMDPDGQNQTRVSSSSFNEYQPAWSPDRTRIAFVVLDFGGEEIYLMDADGQNRIGLTNNTWLDHAPAWSPDGTKIAFATERDGNREIYLMDADGHNPTRLTSNTATDDLPTWSPDGTKIGFMSDRDGNPEIYVMDANGQNPTRLTNNAAEDTDPDWSPDGTKIAFSRSRQIFVMDANGQNPIQLTNGQEEEKPTWSPDGTRIAWECTFIDEICVMDANGQNQTQVTSGSNEAADPAWR